MLRRLLRLFPPETFVPILLAVVVGVGVGLGMAIYQWLLDAIGRLAFGPVQSALRFFWRYSIIVIPVIGGLIAGPLLHYFARETKGYGVPEVMEAVALRGGRISPQIVMNALASLFTIGTGGSAGRIAPVVQIGAGWGSVVGRALRLSPERLRNLVACGAAAGIAATFNAPIAGVFFALEVILGEMETRALSTIVVAAITGSVVGRYFFGDRAIFSIPNYALVDTTELLLYVGLGFAGALVGVLFVRVLEWVTRLFRQWQVTEIFEPALGALVVGLLAVFFPQVLGMGTQTVETALQVGFPWHLLLALCFVKILATAFTLGSGGAGGIFAPALFIGAMLGGAYGALMHRWLPGVASASGAYALVGMATVFAAAVRAPITAVLIIFEMTRDYRIVLPLMLATVLSVVVASLLETESIYTQKLVNAGIDLRAFREFNVMRSITVAEAMTPLSALTTVTTTTSLRELEQLFETTRLRGFPVLDAHGALYGVITFADFRRARQLEGWEERPLMEFCTTDPQVVFPDENLEDALRAFGLTGVGRIPVVARHDARRLIGLLQREDVIRAYARATRDLEERRRRAELWQLQRESRARLVKFALHRGDAAAGKRLVELALPQECLLVSIRRGGQTLVPRGETRLLAGDDVVVMAAPSYDETIRAVLVKGAVSPETAC
jgi:CIC family chloride channel protein